MYFYSASNSNSIDPLSLNALRPISMNDLVASVTKMNATKVVTATQPRF